LGANGEVFNNSSIAVEARLHNNSVTLHQLESIDCILANHVVEVADVRAAAGERRSAVCNPGPASLTAKVLPVVKLICDHRVYFAFFMRSSLPGTPEGCLGKLQLVRVFKLHWFWSLLDIHQLVFVFRDYFTERQQLRKSTGWP
jgi:hypothetical protein